MPKVNILLCAPLDGSIGGITRWTGHILDYYNSTATNINLTHSYPTTKGVYQHTSWWKRWYLGVTTYIPFLLNLHGTLKYQKPDVVHFTSSASISLIRDYITLKIAKRQRVKSIIHFRFGRIAKIYETHSWEYYFLRKVIRLADKVIVIDHAALNTLINHGHPHVVWLPNPIAPQVLDWIQQNNDIKRQPRTLLFAGHLLKTKGVFELVKAGLQIPNIQLKMIGFVTPKMKEDLLQLAAQKQEPWLEILGEQHYTTVINEMLATRVFVLPTYSEGFPNVILESMAAACPIVSTNVGDIPTMLKLNSQSPLGIGVAPQDVDALKEAILTLLNNSDYANQCGNNAHKHVLENYTMSKVWQQLESIWMDLKAS